MSRKASKLFADLHREGWRPGKDFRRTRTFETISEACGCDTNGRYKEGAKAELRIGEGADDYTVRDLFENFVVNKSDGQPVGASFVNEFFDPRNTRNLFEAGGGMDAVDYSAFMGITGQLLVTAVLEPYQKEEYVVRKLIPTHNTPLEEEKIIGITPQEDGDDDDLVVLEKQTIPFAGLKEQYIQLPKTVKRARRIGLTREAIFFDRTGQLVQNAADVGDILAYNEERECIRCVIGSQVAAHVTRFVEKRGFDSAPITLDLFQEASAGSGAYQLSYAYPSRPYNFVNDIPANPLVDYTSIRTCDRYFSDIRDPNRGRPIVIGKPFILACHTLRIDIPRILEAQNIWQLSQQGLTSTGAVVTTSMNPVGTIGLSPSNVVVSRLLQDEMVAEYSTTAELARQIWFYGDIAKAFKYSVNWPLQVEMAPPNTDAQFSQDIVMQWRATKKGKCAIWEPRAWLRNNFTDETLSGT